MEKSKTDKSQSKGGDMKYAPKEEKKDDKRNKGKDGDKGEKKHKEFIPVCLTEETDSISANKIRV